MSRPRAATSVATSTRDASGLEVAEGPLAGALRLVAVDDGGAQAGALEVTADPVRAVLGAAEDQRLARRAIGEDVGQQVALLLLADGEHAMHDVGGHDLLGGHVDAHRLPGECLGDGRAPRRDNVADSSIV